MLEEAQKENFNARTVNSTPYGSDEVRFTVCGSKLYVIVLNPESGTIRVPVLGFGSSEHPGKISSVRMLGSQQNISFLRVKIICRWIYQMKGLHPMQ